MASTYKNFCPRGIHSNYRETLQKRLDDPATHHGIVVRAAVRSQQALRKKVPITLAGPKLEEEDKT